MRLLNNRERATYFLFYYSPINPHTNKMKKKTIAQQLKENLILSWNKLWPVRLVRWLRRLIR